MPVLTLEQVKDQLAFTPDVGAADDALLQGKIAAAQVHVERMLGYAIEDMDPVPPPLVEAVAQLAAWWYLQREAGAVEGRPAEVPFGVREIVAEYREWTF